MNTRALDKNMTVRPAQIRLADGTVFTGQAFGAHKNVDGEVVFTTGMVGYPESLTDPSYRGQILTFTYPLIGNYGVPAGIIESERVQPRAIIVNHYEEQYSHWEAKESLGQWLERHDVVGVTGIDTRALTKVLREHGVLLGQIIVDSTHAVPLKEIQDPNTQNLVSEVSIRTPAVFGHGKKIIAIDTGMKETIMRCLLKRGVQVKRVPWDYNFLNEDWDGLFLSNGPGDPKMVATTIEYLKKALHMQKPIFGICLGMQLMGLAAGGETYKLKYGHRSQNQPCLEVGTKRCYLTTQNHGFALKESSIPKGWRLWFRNANDGTVEGIIHKTKPHFSVQFHPEATAGPEDTEFLFDRFIDAVKKQ
ncbi:MAG TPA: glutamine-hydrolyzing carbamoyl-phosphate synthase small subunit [Patescibacteria group bacterium]|nr:glutamine-hydrolyzing carbamoyl-phosphate synthase small subunit [Patescibacteria group bacterium]